MIHPFKVRFATPVSKVPLFAQIDAHTAEDVKTKFHTQYKSFNPRVLTIEEIEELERKIAPCPDPILVDDGG